MILRGSMCALIASLSTTTMAQSAWTVSTQSATGPVIMTSLPSPTGRSRIAMITFEYARKCDPMLVFAEVEGSKYGTPLKQMLLPPSKIGGTLNGKFYTGTAAVTSYSNGVEVGFAMPDSMAHAVVFDEVKSMAFITPTGTKHELSTQGLRPAVNSALDACVSKATP